MSARRVVEYLVVAGIVERKGSEASITSGASWTGEVLQSFPTCDKARFTLPAGIELFCQPQGWEMVTKPQSPYFIPFILTSETGTRLYCVTLNFYQQHRQPSPEVDDITDLDFAVTTAPILIPQHKRLVQAHSVMSNASIASVMGDDLDMQWDIDMMDGGISSPKLEFEPVSLCAVSMHPLFSTLKHCLRGLYASWVSGEHVLEDIAAKILTEVRLPLTGTATYSLGSLRELRLPSFDEKTSLPLTTTECIKLLRSIGVHNLITLLSAILMDESVLFISSSYSSLTGAVQALVCLVYPFVLPYSLVPIVPWDILEYLQLPSTYIMGVPSQYSNDMPEPLEVIQVYLDDGKVEIPESTVILPLPCAIQQHLEMALNRIIDPCYEYRDSAFPPEINEQLPSVEYQDKQVRAVFLCTILSLVDDYYNHITVLKLCPEPAIAFDKKSFIASHKEDEDTVFTKMADSLVFQNFIQLKAIPYRICDYADDLMAELVGEDRIDLDMLYSAERLSSITRRIAKLLLCDKLESRNDITSQYDISHELLNSKSIKKNFPTLDANKINDLCKELSVDLSEEDPDLCRMAPIVDKLKESHHKTMKRYSSAVNNEIESLKKCLDALFENKIYEARKYIPIITQSFKNDAVARLFVPELVHRLTAYGGFMGQEQFDILVKLMNSALVHESMAARLLPLSTAFYRELCPGTTQQAYSCMQNHLMWESKQFWRDTMYKAIQTELVRIHTTPNTKEDGYTDEHQHFRRRLTQLSEEDDDDDMKSYVEEPEPPTQSGKKAASRTQSEVITSASDSQPIRHRAKLQHSSSQHRLRVAKRLSLMSRSVKMRMKASTVMPGAAEGVAPPDAKPVTIHEALEVLGNQQKLWKELSAEKRAETIKQEDNAVFNQVVLFVSRVIWLRCPLELSEDDQFWKTFTKELEEFLKELLRSVEVDVRLEASLFSKIREMIEGLISLHIASLDNQRRNLKKLPESSRMKIIKPPILQGENILANCVRTFLLPDGRDHYNLLPAEGYFFVTTYRLIFLGTPCDPTHPNTLVTRAMPITALYQLKKIGPQALPTHGISILEGLQLRSLTGQLIKIGFDDEMVSNAKKLHQDIVARKHPRRVVLALSSSDTAEGEEVDTTGQLNRYITDTQKFNTLLVKSSPNVKRKQHSILRKSKVVRQGASISKSPSFNSEEDAMSLQSILSRLSLTPVCHEYERMQVGDIKKEQDKSDHSIWRLSTVNAQYGVCPSYPAVLAVPASVSDDIVISLTSQFEESRFPVVTWRHPASKAVILRSSTFSETTSVSYHKGQHGDAEQAIQGIPNGPMPTRGAARQASVVHLGGSGIYHASMERLLLGVVMCVKKMDSHEYAHGLNDTEILMSTEEFQEYTSIDENPPTPPQRTKRKVTITKSYDERLQSQLKENQDFERGGFSTDEPEGPTFSRETNHASPDPLGIDRPPKKLQMRSDSSHNVDSVKSPTHFSTLPTSPRDWVTVEALPRELSHWKTSPVYIMADKDVLRKVPPTLYRNCTFLPVEGRQYKDIHFSFKKLMRACSPSSPGTSAFLGAIEDSEWLNQLSNLLQLAGAIVDLIDLQCSSVLVALEKGWDYTAQVVSLAQLLLDPYYRTINGFRKLVEKDWIAFGHPFSQRNNLTTESVSQDVGPVFIQFLDCVHQVLMQYPVAFEFNDFYLRMMAYHSCSMRFHTFALNSDKERSERGWQDYPVAWMRSKNVRADNYSSFWTFIENITKESMMFYNFNYSTSLNKDTTVLRPQSFVANLDIWGYYLENHLSQFTPYDPEFISHRNLTLSDIHHKFFSAAKTWESLIPADSQFIPLVRLIHQCVEVTNEIHLINKLSLVMWYELLQHFEERLDSGASLSESEVDAPIVPLIPLRNFITKKHNKVLHNKTSMAVLIKGRLSVEAERNFIHPHAFVQAEVTKKRECNFCKHRLYYKTAFQCTMCDGWYHLYCKNLVPYNCGVKDFLDTNGEEVKPEPMARKRTGSSLFYINHKNTTYEGYLYKKGKMVKSWRLRWFVLDLESKMLSYYDNQSDTKSKGTIDMSEVMSVQTLMNQTAYPSPALRPGEKGYYFQLVTQKRTYQVMSVQEATRHEWMSKLKQCAGIA